MVQTIAHIALVVRDYDEALAFYVDVLGFELVEDRLQIQQNKRWVTVRPKNAQTTLLLARASSPEQEAYIGHQSGGRVFLFLQTTEFWNDYHRLQSLGVRFVRPSSEQDYGIVAVFADLYGNLWDLIQYHPDQPY